MAVLVQAGQDAQRDDEIGREAREWLTVPVNGLRETILQICTPYSQDDINKMVEQHGPTTT